MESNHNKKFDQQVRKKFEDFSAEVSPSLWDAIEKEIKPEEVKIKKLFNFKRYRYISVAAALLIIGFTIWQIQPEEKVFLSGKGTVEETAIVKELEVQPPPVNESVPKIVYKPVTLAMNDGVEEQQSHDSQLDIEKKAEIISSRKPLSVLNTPVENDHTSLVNNVSVASSLNKVLDVSNENLDSLDRGQELAETEPEERQKIVSSILNFVAGNLQIGGDRRVEFTENEHGIIKIGLKGIFARNDR